MMMILTITVMIVKVKHCNVLYSFMRYGCSLVNSKLGSYIIFSMSYDCDDDVNGGRCEFRKAYLHDENDDDDDEKSLALCLLQERDVCQRHGCPIQALPT